MTDQQPEPTGAAGQAIQMAAERDRGDTIDQIAKRHAVSHATVTRRLALARQLAAGGRAPVTGPDVHVSEEATTAAMWGLWVAGRTQQQIADQYRLSQPAVSERLSRYRRTLPDTERELIFRREYDFLERLRADVMAIADDDPPPLVSQGRIIRDEAGAPVADRSLQLAAIDRALKTVDRMAKMFGLDAPARSEIHVEAVSDAARQAAERARAFLEGSAAGEGEK